MAGTVLLCKGDLFDASADLIVLPCSTSGTITSFVAERLFALELPEPPGLMPLGSIRVYPFDGGDHIASFVAYAASVSRNSSDVAAIRRIGEELGRRAEINPIVRRISAPLLGTGAGGLSHFDSFRAISDGFLDFAPDGAELNLYVLSPEVYEVLLSTESEEHSARRRPPKPERVFVSYAHSDDSHRAWVKGLATFLRASGYETRLDVWHLRHGMNMTQWMCNELDLADRCLIICDELYAQKANGRQGGVGWEYRIVEADLQKTQSTNPVRFVPVVRSADLESSLPLAMQGCLAVLCPPGGDDNAQWSEVLEALGGGETAPPVKIAVLN